MAESPGRVEASGIPAPREVAGAAILRPVLDDGVSSVPSIPGKLVEGLVLNVRPSASLAAFLLEVQIADQQLTLRSPEAFPPDTRLELRVVMGETGVRYRVVHAFPPDSTQAREVDGSPIQGIAQALRDAGVPSADRQAHVVANLLAESGAPVEPGMAVAAEILRARLPLSASLLRAGIEARVRGSQLDPTPELHRLVRFVGEHLAPSSERAATLDALRGLLPRGGLTLVRPPTENIESTLERVVAVLRRGDPVLKALDQAMELVRSSPRSEPASLEVRVREVLELRGLADRVDPFREVAAPARGRVLEMLHRVEREHLDQSPLWREFQGVARELHGKVEASSYQQWMEWTAFERGDSTGHVALFVAGEERWPVRFRVDDRRREGGQAGGVAFRLEVETRLLGRVRAEGRLEPVGPGRGDLDLELAAERDETRVRIAGHLDALMDALVEEGYVCQPRVGKVWSQRKVRAPRSTGLDVEA